MTEPYTLEEKIIKIRKAIKGLTDESVSDYNTSYQPPPGKNEADPFNTTQKSLESFLQGKYVENYNRDSFFLKEKRLEPEPIIDNAKDNPEFSRTLFKNPPNKLYASFASDDIKNISSVNPNDKEYSELGQLLDHERENVRKLEMRIHKKDELINTMNARHIALSNEIAELKKKRSDNQPQDYHHIIKSLQEKIEQYSNQINLLQNQLSLNRNSATDLRSEQFEAFQNKIKILEAQNAELLYRNSEVKDQAAKFRQDSQLVQELKFLVEKKDKQIAEVMQENKELCTKLNEANVFKQSSRQEFREFKLKEEINKLKKVNNELYKKAAEPSSKGNARNRSCSSRQAMNEITTVLKCSNAEILQKIKKMKISEKLESRLEKLIKDLSPNNAQMTTKHIWKCIRKLIEEYLKIKKQQNENNDIEKIARLLGINKEEVYEKIKLMCEEKEKPNKTTTDS